MQEAEEGKKDQNLGGGGAAGRSAAGEMWDGAGKLNGGRRQKLPPFSSVAKFFLKFFSFVFFFFFIFFFFN